MNAFDYGARRRDGSLKKVATIRKEARAAFHLSRLPDTSAEEIIAWARSRPFEAEK